MKVLQFGKFYPPVFGGIENVMYEITTGLNFEGVSCDVLCSNDKLEYSEEIIDSYKIYRTKSYGKYFSTSITPQLIEKLRAIQNEYDIITVHFPDPMAALAIFLARPKAKLVIYWHSDIIKQEYILKLYKPLQDWVIKRADLIIGATENHILGSDKSNLFKNKFKIIPYPFNTEILKNCIDDKLYENLKSDFKNKKIIFSMGRLIYYKGFKYLIEASKNLSDDYIILIGGKGVLYDELQAQIDNANLNDKVYLLGSIPHNQLGTYYKFCDIFCLPSTHRSEMFGVVQLEAMSFAKPIVSTILEKSGVCNVNIDNVTGVCVPSEDSKSLSDAFINILNDDAIYADYSKNALNRVNEIYNKKIVINNLIAIYKKLIKESL